MMKQLVALMIIVGGLAIAGVIAALRPPVPIRTEAVRSIDLRAVTPGTSATATFDDRSLTVSVPEGEGYTIGTFTIESAATDAPLVVERSGSLETAWLADVSGDGIEDMVIVVRSGGSGSHATIFVLEGGTDSHTVCELPPIPSTTPGYMGHSAVSIDDGVIVRSFPTYVDESNPRIDRQWEIEEGMRGQPPIKTDPDSNADPSSRTMTLRFDYLEQIWD